MGIVIYLYWMKVIPIVCSSTTWEHLQGQLPLQMMMSLLQTPVRALSPASISFLSFLWAQPEQLPFLTAGRDKQKACTKSLSTAHRWPPAQLLVVHLSLSHSPLQTSAYKSAYQANGIAFLGTNAGGDSVTKCDPLSHQGLHHSP